MLRHVLNIIRPLSGECVEDVCILVSAGDLHNRHISNPFLCSTSWNTNVINTRRTNLYKTLLYKLLLILKYSTQFYMYKSTYIPHVYSDGLSLLQFPLYKPILRYEPE
jgi:hypothetical protein